MLIQNGLKVFVYYNLHKHCWSVKALDGVNKGRVIGHCHALMLESGQCKVSQAGRQRVLNEKRKNVHAGCQGFISSLDKPNLDDGTWQEVTYNPYKYKGFVMKSDLETIVDKWEFCWMENRRLWVK